ncbi:MAG TPA: hypothetical protein VFY29_01850 [Terriglobia bacterium]|nr:hypothetical protein [Terriglobia bacterium]
MPETVPSGRETAGLRWSLPVLLVIAAFAPIFNNGFIADDFVILRWAEGLKVHPLYLFDTPHYTFRTTLFVVFLILKSLFGYHTFAFYAFSILLHSANVLLLGYLVWTLTGDSETAFWGSCFAAVFSAPQEAVMWLSGMTESLLAFFLLVTLILWLKDRPLLAACAFVGALFSKESAVIALALAPLIDLYRGRRVVRPAYVALLVPAALFGVSFLATWHSNGMINEGIFTVGPQALSVLALTAHRMLWPWFYIVVVVIRFAGGAWPSWGSVGRALACVLLLLAPYIFITYARSLPSRNVYLASAALMAGFSVWLEPVRKTRLFSVFAAAFIAFNVGYLWIRKDRQFEERAAPTTALLRALAGVKPQNTLIIDFPYPYPEIARESVLLLPGWSPDAIQVGDSPAVCPDCRQLKWNMASQDYEGPR